MMNGRDNNRLERLWGDGAVRVFISHTHEHKQEATGIKNHLGNIGMAAFVAHEDIEPMKEWEIEIEHALSSMDLLVALLTERFSESKWTDQEIGFAVGRQVPIVPVRMGKDPYGFMGKYQAISGSQNNREIADAIFLYALSDESLKSSATDSYIMALDRSGSFSRSNLLAKYLPQIEHLSREQEETLVTAFNGNSQVSNAFDLRADIVEHLKRMTGSDYELADRKLRLVETDDGLPF